MPFRPTNLSVLNLAADCTSALSLGGFPPRTILVPISLTATFKLSGHYTAISGDQR